MSSGTLKGRELDLEKLQLLLKKIKHAVATIESLREQEKRNSAALQSAEQKIKDLEIENQRIKELEAENQRIKELEQENQRIKELEEENQRIEELEEENHILRAQIEDFKNKISQDDQLYKEIEAKIIEVIEYLPDDELESAENNDNPIEDSNSEIVEEPIAEHIEPEFEFEPEIVPDDSAPEEENAEAGQSENVNESFQLDEEVIPDESFEENGGMDLYLEEQPAIQEESEVPVTEEADQPVMETSTVKDETIQSEENADSLFDENKKMLLNQEEETVDSEVVDIPEESPEQQPSAEETEDIVMPDFDTLLMDTEEDKEINFGFEPDKKENNEEIPKGVL